MLDLSPSPPGGLSLFSTFQKEPPATNKSVADPGEGPGGPAPPYVGTKLRPQGPKKFCWETAPPIYLRIWIIEPPRLISRSGSSTTNVTTFYV